MSRTFTLGRLMLGITAFCVICGVAVNLPLEILIVLMLLTLLTTVCIPPAVMVGLVLASMDQHRYVAVAVTLLAAIAALLVPDPCLALIGSLFVAWAMLITKHLIAT